MTISKKIDLRGTVLVSSSGGDFSVPRNAVNPLFDYQPLLKQLFEVDRPILVAAGPIAKILIYDYWRLAPRKQVIVDIGSVLDPMIYGRPTRGYHNGRDTHTQRVCHW